MQYAGIEHVVRKGVNWPCKIREWRQFTAKYLRNQAPFYNGNSTELMKIRIFRIRERIWEPFKVNLLVRRDELKTEQDAVLADCEDLQALLTTLVKETTVWSRHVCSANLAWQSSAARSHKLLSTVHSKIFSNTHHKLQRPVSFYFEIF